MVKLSYKSKNIESAYMVMAGIDKQEQILYSDTLHLIPGTNIVSLSRKIHLQQKIFHNLSAIGLACKILFGSLRVHRRLNRDPLAI
ncbi:hypothetical protein D7D25_13475 [Proteiniphilum sp. X52]|nr:hypothetical protein D7D25_13475 [Proteiniphilum sp. X52]